MRIFILHALMPIYHSDLVLQILLRTNPTLALCVFASVAFIAATVAIFLPVETRNVGLKVKGMGMDTK